MAVTINASTSAGLVQTADTSGVLQLQTNSGTTALTIDTSQNVGIGTTSPSYKLQVYGASNPEMRLGDAVVTYQLYTEGATAAVMGTVGSHALVYRTNATERMRIDTSGNVLVGTTSALNGTARLDILAPTGNNVALTLKNDAGAGQWTSQIWNSATSGNNAFMQFATEGTYTGRGSIDYNRAGNAVRYNTSSDQRLKENIVDSSSAIPLLESIKIRSFDWKETGFHVDYGVIAQELNEVVPDAVSIGDDNQDGIIKRSWGVDTSVLVPAMIKAIQEQQTIINDLTARIETLEGASL